MSRYLDSCYSNFDIVVSTISTLSYNGDDSIELYWNNILIDSYGETGVLMPDDPYEDSWAYRNDDGLSFTEGGEKCADLNDPSTDTVFSVTKSGATCTYPFCVATSGGEPDTCPDGRTARCIKNDYLN